MFLDMNHGSASVVRVAVRSSSRRVRRSSASGQSRSPPRAANKSSTLRSWARVGVGAALAAQRRGAGGGGQQYELVSREDPAIRAAWAAAPEAREAHNPFYLKGR